MASGRWRRSLRADDGSVAVELALMTPVLLAFLMLVVVTGRVTDVDADVQNAAAAAARAAAQHATPSAATDAARDTAQANLATSTPCLDVDVTTDVGRLEPGGAVTVTVRCRADLSDVAVVAVPGSWEFVATRSEVVDTYIGRGP